MSVALTGATGFIGSTIARFLVRKGYAVRALIRDLNHPRRFDCAGLTWVEGDLLDMSSLERLVASCGFVVHCAGLVRGRSPEDFNPVNVDGVERIAKAAQKSPILPKFLLFSSLAAREPDISSYAASKKGGEDALASAAGDMEWLVLRPPAVYGPGDRELLPLLKWMKRGILPIPGNPRGRFSLIYVDDLAAAVAACLESDRDWSGACMELHDGRDGGYGWDDIADVMVQLYHHRMRKIVIPRRLLVLLSAVNIYMSRWFGYLPMLTPGKVRELCHEDWVCENSAIHQFSGWVPSIPFSGGVRKTLKD